MVPRAREKNRLGEELPTHGGHEGQSLGPHERPGPLPGTGHHEIRAVLAQLLPFLKHLWNVAQGPSSPSRPPSKEDRKPASDGHLQGRRERRRRRAPRWHLRWDGVSRPPRALVLVNRSAGSWACEKPALPLGVVCELSSLGPVRACHAAWGREGRLTGPQS